MSEWKQGAAKRRDARASKDEPRPVGGSRRNTKRWCRGKVGVEHVKKCVEYQAIKRYGRLNLPGWKLLICTACGKELDRYCPSPHWPHEPPPPWAQDSASASPKEKP